MKTIIFECEFFAVFCTMWSWREKLTGCNIVIHTDNDGVRDSFISCHATSDNAVPILNACLQLEFEAAMNTWTARAVRCGEPCQIEIVEAPRPDSPTPCCQKCAFALAASLVRVI